MSAVDDRVSGVRAARLRLGLSQRQVAERMQVHVDTYQHWDKGRNRPSDPAMLQLLSMVLETPLDVLYPPEANPRVARALLNLERSEDVGSGGRQPGDEITDAADHVPDPVAEPVAVEPLALERSGQPHRTGRRRGARVAVLAAIGLTAALAVTIVAVGGSNDRAAVDGRDAAAAGIVRQDQKARADMKAAADRGDFDHAITVAARIGDVRAASQYRTSAAKVLVRRASKAASRGDLSLARKRLSSATDRYKTAPGADAVRARVRRIERDRRRRAAEQRRRAQRRAAASSAPSPTAPAPAPSAPAPAAPAPAVTPAPKSEPNPSTGSTRKPSREREQAVDPGLF